MRSFQIDDQELSAITQLVWSKTGIRLGDTKRSLVVARLASRLRALGYQTFRQYYEQLDLHDPDGAELRRMINRLTTNTTAFFRERHHFDFLRERLIPALVARSRQKVRIWSAGCSTGQEPYSIAMSLAEDSRLRGWDIRILASDIDTEVLKRAESGEYTSEDAASVPLSLRSQSFEVAGDRVRVVPRVRDLVTFRRINLVEDGWPIRVPFDAIFAATSRSISTLTPRTRCTGASLRSSSLTGTCSSAIPRTYTPCRRLLPSSAALFIA